MSRNLCSTGCNECPGGSDHIVLEEAPRPIEPDDLPAVYRNDYVGLVVAKAHCVLCRALYIAWVDWPTQPHSHWHLATKGDGARFCDLSYRHAFNDEPSVLDLPVYEVVAVTSYRRRATTQHSYFSDRIPEDAARFKARWDASVRRDGTSTFEWETIAPPATPKEKP